jgi:aquaporin Z
MKKYLTEFIGTFFLVLSIGLAVVGEVAMAPLAIGTTLMIMVYMGLHVSGAHYNPAVTLAVLMRGAMDGKDVLPYMVAQFFGAILATLVTVYVMGLPFAPMPSGDASALGALLVEFLFTFALCLVYLHTATSDDVKGNSYYGLAIGFTIVAAILVGGPVSGGAFNPAVGLGSILVDVAFGGPSLGGLWLYLVGPFLGGVAAALVYRYQTS